ncbi:MAG: porin family protein, partial [Devosia sp.]|nr:porin family protein [Devosia sp.]
PIGDLYSFPFQGNTNFGVGPHSGTQEILNVQPVIPFHVSDDWNIITRTILPLVWNPDMSPLPSTAFGTAPTTFSAFLSPRNPTDGWLWGVGPVVLIPTATSPTLGSSVWGGGATGVLVYMKGPWVAGVLVNNVWSFGGTNGTFGTSYNNFLTQPFVNYNFGGGWYVTTSPIVTANWENPGTKWTIPIGGGAGRVVKIGKLPVNFMVGAYYNVVRPEYGADWQLRTQVTFIF